MIKQISIKTVFGWVSAFEEKNKIFKVKFSKCKNKSISKNLKNFKTSLIKFTEGNSKSIKFNFFARGSAIQKKVWNELQKIKYGKTKSYGEIAKKLKLSPRHVGKICGQNQIILKIPCHRVVRSDGSLGGFSASGGILLKRKILKLENNYNGKN